MKFILAIDQGTSSSRAIIFDESAKIIASAQRPHRQIYPQPGWVEHDASEIVENQLDVAREAIRIAKSSHGIDVHSIASVGLTNQRETVVLWDRKTGLPVHHAIVWQDRRTQPQCHQLTRDGFAYRIKSATGLVIDPYFSGSKMRWMLDNIPGARERAGRGELAFGTIDSFLIFRLTDGRKHVTDVSNASRTMLFNIHRLDWDDELLQIFDVPRELLPEVVSSCDPNENRFGETRAFGPSIQIGGVAGDQQAALFGQCCFAPGQAKTTYGTGCFMLMNVGERPSSETGRLLSTIAWRVGSEATHYAVEGSVFVGGAVIQWLRDELGIIRSSDEAEAIARSVPDSGGVMFVPAFAGLGAPVWDAEARGLITGITRGTNRAHIVRAALDSIALQVCDVADAMRDASAIRLTEMRVDGGAVVNDLLMQRQADLLGVPVVRPKMIETTALGAAMLAGMSAGCFRDLRQLGQRIAIDRIFEPSISRDQAISERETWRRAVERARSVQHVASS